ncbi:MAG TPA: CocE/NonD family hydrolase [Mycobacteriales bacterium]|nr:CocE/NonD family hydrolase [Mycobacteriales bacterium]
MRRRRWAVAIATASVLTVPGAGGLGGPASGSPREDLGALEHVRIPSHDGVVLNGWVARPKGPQKNLPTVLINTPYLGTCSPLQLACPLQPSWGDEVPAPVADALDENHGSYWDEWEPHPGASSINRFSNSLGFPLIHLVKAGYAVALVSVRGTGDSGGCFEHGGQNEQQDAKLLVEWLAKQPWSNRKLAMGGLSYISFTTWQAAVQAPAALKATITAGELIHPWEFSFTPQGARNATSVWNDPGWNANYAAHLPGPGSHPLDFQPTLCPGQVVASAHPIPEWATDTRDQQWFAERSLRQRMRNVRAAVLSSQGFLEVAPHGFQDSLMWETLPARVPKRFVRGWWGHTWPSAHAPRGAIPTLNPSWGKPGWEAIVLEWLDAYLRGGKKPQRVGVMDFSDGTAWHSSRKGWKVRQEVLYLGGSTVRPTASSASTTFRNVPISSFNSSYSPLSQLGRFPSYDAAVCEPATSNGTVAAVYDSAPLPRPAVVAGNPFAYLNVSSDQPRGLVNVEVYDVAPDAHCADPNSETGTVGVRWVSSGTVDLAFYASHFAATPFPVNSAQRVRVDLLDTAASVPAGHRLRVVVSYGSAMEHRIGRLQDVPLITIRGDSQLVLPVFQGTLGGRQPAQQYPPRPFLQ